MKSKKINVWVKFLALLLLMLNGNYPLVYFGYAIGEGPSRVIWTVIIIIIIIIKLRFKIRIKPLFVVFYLAFIILTIVQNEYLNSFFLQEFLNLSFLFFITYLITFAIGLKGILYVPKLMVKLIKISLFFYIPSAFLFFLGIDWKGLIIPFSFQSNEARIGTFRKPLHMLFHNFASVFRSDGANINTSLPRNSGMYWEPGAFAGCIIMVFILVLIYKKYYSDFELKNINKWFFIGLLSTFSTTGLLIVPMLVLFYFLRNRKVSVKVIMKLFLLSSLVSSISIFAFLNIPTLNEKINDQVEKVESNERGSETTRLGSLFLVSQLVIDNPYIGVGFAASNEQFTSKLGLLGYEFTQVGIGNGMILMLAWSGIPYFLFLLFLMAYNFNKLCVSLGLSLGFIFILLLLLQGESWMKLPLIYSFCFLSNTLTKKEYDN